MGRHLGNTQRRANTRTRALPPNFLSLSLFVAEADNAVRPYELSATPLAPERFAGYVQSTAARPFSAAGLEPTYACVSQPHASQTLSWTIADDYIHFKHEYKVRARSRSVACAR